MADDGWVTTSSGGLGGTFALPAAPFPDATGTFRNQVRQSLTVPWSISRVAPSMERVVRPFLTVDSQPPAVVIPRRLLPGEDTEAFISWGDESRFVTPQITDPIVDDSGLLSPGFNLQWPKKRDKDDPEKKAVIRYTELKRETEDVRVENPDDSAQYVMVQRIKKISFRNEKTGTEVEFVLKPPSKA